MGAAQLKLLRTLAFLGKHLKKRSRVASRGCTAGATPAHLEPLSRKGRFGGPSGPLDGGHRQLLKQVSMARQLIWGPPVNLKSIPDPHAAQNMETGEGD